MIRFILFIHLILVATSLSAQTLKFVHGKPSEKKLNHYDEKYGIEKLMTAPTLIHCHIRPTTNTGGTIKRKLNC